MSTRTEKPVLFVKHECPFCLKVRLYLLEAGLIDSVTLRESRSPEEEKVMRAELEPHLDKVSYPTLRVDDSYMTESDDIITRFAREGGPAKAKRVREPRLVENTLAQPLLALTVLLSEAIGHSKSAQEEAEIKGHLVRCLALAEQTAAFLKCDDGDNAYWVENSYSKRAPSLSLTCPRWTWRTI